MKNKELFAKDPLTLDLLNQGVSRVTNARDANEEKVARFELQTFVCDGQYATGLTRVLRSFINNLERPEQAAAWVSGFYGSGKSHLVKMLRFLWTNHKFSDGATARSLVTKLPAEITDLLAELDTEAKRHGGIHAAAGTMGEGGIRHVRISVLSILFRSLGLPTAYHQSSFVLWLRQKGYEARVKKHLSANGTSLDAELPHLFVSTELAAAVASCDPALPQDSAGMLAQLTAQFPQRDSDISNEEMLQAIRESLVDEKGNLPCTLIVLDEVQQFIDRDARLAYDIQEMAEVICKNLNGRVLLVATGQSALTDVPYLQKLLARFKITIQLTDADVDSVIRNVLLQKRPDRTASLAKDMESWEGEISRQLSQSKIASSQEDRSFYVTDYPLLPVRRRFWERILRTVDSLGTNAQLRTQLDIVHQANRAVADNDVGCVVACDFLYEQKATEWQQTGVLPQEFHSLIMKLRQKKKSADILKSRLCALMFLISKIPIEAHLGIEAIPDSLADLLSEDIRKDSAPLRQEVRKALDELLSTGAVSKLGEEYRLQTREGSEWEREYKNRYDQLVNDEAGIAQARSDALKEKVQDLLGSSKILQGSAKLPRKIELFFGNQMPAPSSNVLPVWVRDGWTDQEEMVKAEARQAGTASAVTFLYLPKSQPEELRKTLASRKAAEAVIAQRGAPTSPEGQQARLAMETRQREAELRLENLIASILLDAKVWLAGGEEQPGLDLYTRVQESARDAATRLFPHFAAADSDKWDKVLARAKGGDGNALKLIGFNGDAHTHPVCSAVLSYVGPGKRGGEIIKHFEGDTFGWPVEAVCAAMVLLASSGYLRASQAGARVEARNLSIQQLRAVDFRCENITLTAPQKIAIRQVFQTLGVGVTPNRETESIPDCLAALEQRAGSAGGDPPAPAKPNPPYLEQLRGLAGNEFLLALFNCKDQVLADWTAWSEQASKLAQRLPRWQALESLLAHSRGLAEGEDIRQQSQAIAAQRSILSDPDPVTPLAAFLVDLLRQKACELRDAAKKLQSDNFTALEIAQPWQKISPTQREQLESRFSLRDLPPLDVGSESALIASLSQHDLARWQMLIEAIPQRFANALQEAARLLEPKATPVHLPPATLHDDSEVDAWLKNVEMILKEKVKQSPVILS